MIHTRPRNGHRHSRRRQYRTHFQSQVAALPSRWEYGTEASDEVVYRYDPGRDGFQEYKADSLDFVTLANLLKSGESGQVRDLMILNRDLEARDGHLQTVSNTRRLAITGMDWSIEPAKIDGEGSSYAQDRKAAELAADYVREAIRRIEADFVRMLRGLSLAIGPNLAVTEILWRGWAPIGFTNVPPERLVIDYSKSPDIRIETPESSDGVLTTPGKFLVHSPASADPFPFRRTMTRAASFLAVIKRGNVQDWTTFAEVFGMPLRWASYQKGTSASHRDEILAGLAAMGSDAYGIFPEGVQMEIKEANRGQGSSPFAELIGWVETKQSLLYLGQNLTTEISGAAAVGSRAAAEIHDNVRRDLLEDDIRAERSTVEGQLFLPMLTYAFPRRAMPCPRFVRTFRDVQDRLVDANILAVAVNQLGMKVEAAHAYETLGIPEPERDIDGEKTINPLLEGAPVAPALPGAFSVLSELKTAERPAR